MNIMKTFLNMFKTEQQLHDERFQGIEDVKRNQCLINFALIENGKLTKFENEWLDLSIKGEMIAMHMNRAMWDLMNGGNNPSVSTDAPEMIRFQKHTRRLLDNLDIKLELLMYRSDPTAKLTVCNSKGQEFNVGSEGWLVEFGEHCKLTHNMYKHFGG
jgi:hypothetical protein